MTKPARRKKLLKTRKRLPSAKSMKALHAGRDKAFKEAPRLESGKIVPAFRYKKVIDAYKRHGVKPKSGFKAHSRPLFVKEPKIGKQIIKFIGMGYPYTTVCRAVGVSRDAFMKWLTLGQSNATKEYASFYRKVCRAEAKAEIDNLEELKKHQKYDWRSSAWMLERRWPEHWARRDAEKASLKVNGQITVTHKHELSKKVASDPAALELARKMIDGNEFGYDEVAKDGSTNTTETT